MGKEYEPSMLLQQGQIYTQAGSCEQVIGADTVCTFFFSIFLWQRFLNDEEFRALLCKTCHFSVL